MVNKERLEIIKTYYESNLGKDLPEYSILGWESEEAQHLRFAMLVSAVDLEGKRVLDVGCGLGNLLDYLKHKNINVKYTGVDILQSMVDCALMKKQSADFYCTDIFKTNPFEKESFDVVYASGVFNLNLGNNTDFLYTALNLFLELSCEAVAFNLLHCNSPDKENQYYYYSPDDVKAVLERIPNKVKKLNIIENYLQNDFTVICYKK